MGKTRNSGLGIGVGTSPQRTIVNYEYDKKVDELIKNEYDGFDSSKLDYEESKTKYDEYLFKIDHIDGGSKAKFLKEILGYETGDGKKLHNAIQKSIEGAIPNKTVVTEYGTKYNFYVKLEGKDGIYYSANVVIVIQNDKGKTYWRLITLFPRKKEE